MPQDACWNFFNFAAAAAVIFEGVSRSQRRDGIVTAQEELGVGKVLHWRGEGGFSSGLGVSVIRKYYMKETNELPQTTTNHKEHAQGHWCLESFQALYI